MKEINEPRLLAVLEQSTHIGKWTAYERYRDSGVEWVGKIPEHWKVRRLKGLSKDMVAGPFGSSLTKDMYTKEGYRVYGQEQVIPGDFSVGDYYISENMYHAMHRYAIVPGDILISCVGTFGKIAVVPLNAEPGIINPRLIKLIPNENIISTYLGLLLRSEISSAQIEQLSHGGTMGIINLALLNQIVLPLPPLVEQQAIATFLDRETTKINELIAKKERMIELLQERRTAIINQAVIRGLNPGVPMKDSGVVWLGEIPAHWEVKKLKYVAKFLGGGTPSKANEEYWSGDIPWLSPKDMKSEIILDTEDHISIEALEQSTTNLIKPGAVFIVVRSGILRHSIPVAINHIPVTINQDIKAILPQKELLSQYLASFIHSQQRTLLTAWRKYGATVESIEYDLLVNTPIPIPPIKEQEAILIDIQQKIAPIDKLISVIQEGIKKLKEYNAALISAAVTGKIDVRGEITAVAVEETAI